MKQPQRTYEQHVAWVKAGRPQAPVRPAATRVWRVSYLGKILFESGQYSHCVVYRNQFKGQKDYDNYKIQ